MPKSNPDANELSIIIPLLNEAARLPVLLDLLSRQTDIGFEVLLCDGGSDDDSADLFEQLRPGLAYPCRFLQTARGRGVQLNAGAVAARGEYLLFLHADSRFQVTDALRQGLESYRQSFSVEDKVPVAGHFRLRFDDAPADLIARLAYWEVKASLDRPGCTHGDQGFLLHRDVYAAVGPFFEDWNIFEDTFFAEDLRSRGRWILLPPILFTSARRFASEGLSARQTLNALLMNFREIGWSSYFQSAAAIYRQQSVTDQLLLKPFLIAIRQQLNALSLNSRLKLWYRTGRYVRNNAWQLLLARRVKKGDWSVATPVRQVETALWSFDRGFDLLSRHPVGYVLTALLTWLWFQRLCRRED